MAYPEVYWKSVACSGSAKESENPAGEPIEIHEIYIHIWVDRVT